MCKYFSQLKCNTIKIFLIFKGIMIKTKEQCCLSSEGKSIICIFVGLKDIRNLNKDVKTAL